MSYLEHNGERLYVFGKGGGARTAELMKVPLLAEIPLDPETREGGDNGRPVATAQPPTVQTSVFEKLAVKVVESAREADTRRRPTISVAD
jgi:ATP-binding protein involved in chromosome partitioning